MFAWKSRRKNKLQRRTRSVQRNLPAEHDVTTSAKKTTTQESCWPVCVRYPSAQRAGLTQKTREKAGSHEQRVSPQAAEEPFLNFHVHTDSFHIEQTERCGALPLQKIINRWHWLPSTRLQRAADYAKRQNAPEQQIARWITCAAKITSGNEQKFASHHWELECIVSQAPEQYKAQRTRRH